MSLIIVTALVVQYSCEVVSSLGTCFDLKWFTQCTDNCHSISVCHYIWRQ